MHYIKLYFNFDPIGLKFYIFIKLQDLIRNILAYEWNTRNNKIESRKTRIADSQSSGMK